MKNIIRCLKFQFSSWKKWSMTMNGEVPIFRFWHNYILQNFIFKGEGHESWQLAGCLLQFILCHSLSFRLVNSLWKKFNFCNSYDFFPLFWIECIRVKCTSIKDSSFVSKCIALFIFYGYCSFDFHAIQGGKDSLANKRMLIAGDPFMLPLAPPKK